MKKNHKKYIFIIFLGFSGMWLWMSWGGLGTVGDRWGAWVVCRVYGLSSKIYNFYATRAQYFNNANEDNFEVNERCEKLQARVIALESALQYAELTRGLQNFMERYTAVATPHVPIVSIIVTVATPDEQYCLIDQGSDQNIVVDMVGVYKNILIGRVVEVWPSYSKLLLITDQKSHVAAYCAETKIAGIIRGHNDPTMLSLDFVTHLSDPHVGDLILSSGQGLIYPGGFGIGTITGCERDGLTYTIKVRPLIDPRRLTHCAITSRAGSAAR